MNRNDFIEMISDRVPLDRHLIGEIYELVDIFPYFQSAHMLLLKGLMKSADVKFDNQLRNSAIHIADREVLYYQLNKKTSAVASHYQSTAEKSLTVDSTADTGQTVIESAKNSADMINEIENVSGDNKSHLKQDILNHPAAHSILIASESDIEDTAGIVLSMEEESYPGEDKVFFMDPGFSFPVNDDLLELDTDENQAQIITKESDTPGTPDVIDVNSKKRIQSDLIDKFIIANPRIEPVRDKSTPVAEEIFTPFVNEERSFITETLARIYISQGYYSKAIDIFEKLSLKFPEKNSYFASQIEKVKEYIKK
jgi:hypothetical protein